MIQNQYIRNEYAKDYIKPRPKEFHKGNCGRVLIIAGSYGMAGAAVLCGNAALKSGAGLVTLAVPSSLFEIVQCGVTEATCIRRDEILKDHKKSYLEQFNAIAIGPGMGKNIENFELIKFVLSATSCPVVIDADGINTICEYDDTYTMNDLCKHRIIFTPHPGEANRMLHHYNMHDINSHDRYSVVRGLADITESVVLLKGNETLVTAPNDIITVNTTGNAGMATGGSGDVLTGVITALAGASLDSCVATRCGAYMHGLAGDIAADHIGQWGMTAKDILACLPEAFKTVVGC